MDNILRVFPHRTSYTPDDKMVYIGMPDMLIPEHDEVHISCTFTWDRPYCKELQYQWQGRTDKPVKLGGGGIRIRRDNIYARTVSEKQYHFHVKGMQ